MHRFWLSISAVLLLPLLALWVRYMFRDSSDAWGAAMKFLALAIASGWCTAAVDGGYIPPLFLTLQLGLLAVALRIHKGAHGLP